MFEGYRVVAVTPAGRRRYMELLVPQILACALVDRYDIWVNTADPADLAFLEGLAAKYERVRLVPQPDGRAPGVQAIHAFHRGAIDADTIYVRFDDDIVWLEPGFFETLLRFRVDHPGYFLVMPLIVNNAVCSNLLQTLGKIMPWRHIHTNCFDRIGWAQPEFALALHRFVLDLIRRGETARLHSGAREISLNRFSINCISWFGRDLALVGGEVQVEEEEDLAAAIPARLRRSNCFCTDTIAAHFAFWTQRHWLDKSGVLEEYDRALEARPELASLRTEIRALRRAADARHTGVELEGGVKVRRARRKLQWRILRRILTGKYKFKKERARVYLTPGPAL
jgi:hypothetical protein